MKPLGRVARRGDYVMAVIGHAFGAQFIRAHHYARECSNTGIMHGFFRGGRLVGVAQWLPPTKVCAQSVDAQRWQAVLSLTRFAVLDSEPTNAETIMLGASIRQLRRERRWTALVTFADESQHHSGTIYRASNWEYRGKTKPEPRYLDPDGRQVSRKAGRKSRTHANMLALGYRMAGRYAKHKFVLRIGGRL